MYGRQTPLILIVLACIAPPLQAQQESISSQDVEELLYLNEEAIVPETLSGNYTDASHLPLDLNIASAEDLKTSGLFTAYQVDMLLQYRDRYGLLYSIYELAMLPGFHRGSPLELAPHVNLSMIQAPDRKKPGKHMFLFNLERSFPTAADQTKYAGSPLKTSFRIRSYPGEKLSLALSYEKDAGEQLLYRNRPQFLSAYFSYKGDRFIKQFVLGNYQLNQGLGLVSGAGFIHRPGNFHVTQLSVSRIKPYASLSESMFEKGIACKMGSGHFQVLLWGSYHRFSLSPSKLLTDPDPEKWLEFQWTSGLYKTSTELEGRNLAYRIHCGMQLLFRQRTLTVGFMSGSQWLGPSKQGMELLEYRPDPSHEQKYSLHVNWFKRKIQVFSELASSEFRSLAFLLGTRYNFNDFVQGSLLLHHFGTDYRGCLPSSYGSGSKIRNEQGVAFHLHLEPGRNFTAELTGELFRYPAPRHLTNIPSSGYRLKLSIQNSAYKMIHWKARFVSRSWQSSPAAGLTSGIRPLQDSRSNRIDMQLTYKPLDWLRWQSRLVISYLSGKHSSPSAHVGVQQLALGSTRRLKVITQFVLYHVEDWENRIYLYEPGFYYSFNFPAFYGKGQKTTLLLSLHPVKQLTVSARLSGSVNRNIRKWESGIQLRVNL